MVPEKIEAAAPDPDATLVARDGESGQVQAMVSPWSGSALPRLASFQVRSTETLITQSRYAHPAPLRDENSPREEAEESEVAGRHQNSGPKDHKGAR